jgi:hypothetical protein
MSTCSSGWRSCRDTIARRLRIFRPFFAIGKKVMLLPHETELIAYLQQEQLPRNRVMICDLGGREDARTNSA